MPALDYRDNRIVPGGDREFISGRGNDLIAIDYPTLALFTGKYYFLKDRFPGIFETRFSEWMLDGGVGFESINDKNRWAELTLTNVRDQLRQGKFGIFSPAFKRFETRQEGQDKDFSITGNGDGFSVTTYPSVYDAPGTPQEFRDLIASVREITSGMKGNPTTIKTSSGDDVVMPGWLGNGDIDTGSGDDIILSSPQMHAAVLHATDKRPVNSSLKSGIDIYYPIAYAQKQDSSSVNNRGNVYHTGKGSDLIYFDGGTAEARGEEGNDIFAPSFGSFNWSSDTLIQHSRDIPRNRADSIADIPFEVLDKPPKTSDPDQRPIRVTRRISGSRHTTANSCTLHESERTAFTSEHL